MRRLWEFVNSLRGGGEGERPKGGDQLVLLEAGGGEGQGAIAGEDVAECVGEGAGRGDAVFGPFGESAGAERRDAGGNALVDLRKIVGIGIGQLFQDGHDVWAIERGPSGEHLVHHHAEREEVAAMVDGVGFGQHLLGRHVAGRADQLARAAEGGIVDE